MFLMEHKFMNLSSSQCSIIISMMIMMMMMLFELIKSSQIYTQNSNIIPIKKKGLKKLKQHETKLIQRL